MNKIVVPTDFSPTAAVALHLASRLAEATGYDLQVVHVHDGYGEGASLVTPRGAMGVRMEKQRKIDQFIRFNVSPKSFSGARDLETLPVLRSGEVIGIPADKILEISQREDTALMVMGSVGTGARGSRALIFGSVARTVALGGGCPVLLIPRGMDTVRTDRAAIAFEQTEDLKAIVGRIDFLRAALGLDMHFAHVMEEDADTEARTELALLNEVLDTGFPGYPVQLDLLQSGRITDRLDDYLLKDDIDLLVMGRHHRSLLERLFLRPEVRPLLTECSMPLLVVPIDK